MDDAGIWVLVGAAVLSCIFGAVNIALKTYSRTRLIELFESRGKESTYDWFVQHLSKLLLTAGAIRSLATLVILLGVLYSIEKRLQNWELIPQYALALAVSAIIVVAFTVAIPLSIAAYLPERLIVLSLPALRVLMLILSPIVYVLQFTDPIIRRISGADLNKEDSSDVTDEVLSMVEEHQGEGMVDAAQRDLIEAVFEFPSITAGEIMTPRTDTKGIAVTTSLDEARDRILEYGHSRIPVYEDNIDHIVGILYAKDLIRFIGHDDADKFALAQVMREPMRVPESKPVRELLAEFKADKIHMAIVIDEYGGTAGLVTVEDIIEELVGEIHDEYEETVEAPQIRTIDDTTVEAEGRVYIDDLNDECDLELPEDEDYDTVGGFVFATLGHIPEAGEAFEYENIRLTVLDVERTKVTRVRIERLASAAVANGDKSNGNGNGHGK